jgi:hypothetical protein
VTDPTPAEAIAPRFPCACCGHLVFDERVGSHEICPVCFWDDDLVQTRWPNFTGGANKLSLVECQRNYQTLGAKQARVLKYVRPAAENEPVDAGWYPLGQAALDCFEPVDEQPQPWPQDRTVLYWWRPNFWRTQPPGWAGWAGAADLTDPENWHGGFYELAIELADESDEYLQRMLTALWHTAEIDGCYQRRAGTRDQFKDAPCTVAALDQHGHLHATVLLPTGQRVVCGAVAIRGGGGTDWLDFYLPMEALGRADQRVGAFPFVPDGDHSALDWRRPIDEWLAGIATTIFQAEPFRLALIGHEVSGDTDADKLDGRVPEQRFIGYLLPHGSQLDYMAANR